MVDVRIKPLEWTQTADGYISTERREQWGADTPWGPYYIWYYRFPSEAAVRGPQYKITGPGIAAHHIVGYPSLEAAQVAVQSIHDQHVRSTLSDAVAEREAEPVATLCTLGVGDGSGKLFVHGDYDSIKAAQAIIFQANEATSELEALRKRVAEIDDHRRKVLAENERLLNALIERVRRVAELEGAMDPFAWVAEHDIGESEADDDLFRPMERHNRAPRLTVGHLRTARRVREGGKVNAP